MVALADTYLDGLSTDDLERQLPHDHRDFPYCRQKPSSSASRTTTGCTSARPRPCARCSAMRRLAQFVGDIDAKAAYRREPRFHRKHRWDAALGGGDCRGSGLSVPGG